jgi:hypothetical protein
MIACLCLQQASISIRHLCQTYVYSFVFENACNKRKNLCSVGCEQCDAACQCLCECRIEGTPFDTMTKQGELCLYYVFGAACTEVEIDTLTGNYSVSIGWRQ